MVEQIDGSLRWHSFRIFQQLQSNIFTHCGKRVKKPNAFVCVRQSVCQDVYGTIFAHSIRQHNTGFYLTTYLYLLRVCDPCIYPIRVPPLQKPLLCPEPMLMAIENQPHSKRNYGKLIFPISICFRDRS